MSMMEGRGVLRSPAVGSGTIAAVSISTLVAPLFDAAGEPVSGSVLSVHGSAINLLLDGSLVTIAAVRTGGLPNGVLVEEPFEPRRLGVRDGMPVRAGSGRLAIDAAGFAIRVGRVRRWRPELPAIACPDDLEVRAGIARRGATRTQGGLDGIVSGHEAFVALAAALAADSDREVVAAGRALVGLGAGLTPAGDDVLVGLTAGLTALGDPRARPLARSWAGYAAGRTTVVAEAFHGHAAAGAYSERLHDLVRAIVRERPGAIPKAIGAAAAWGATSGADTIAGVVLALGKTVTTRAVRVEPEAA
jgi:Protein of unknown function (DUF2877)